MIIKIWSWQPVFNHHKGKTPTLYYEMCRPDLTYDETLPAWMAWDEVRGFNAPR